MSGFVQTHYKVAYPQYQFAKELTRGCNEDTYRLFCHILACSLMRITARQDDLYIPIAWTLIRHKIRKASWKKLWEMELIDDPTAYSIPLHRSREYKVRNWILTEFIGLGEMSAEDYLAQQVNLFTGKPSSRVQKSEINDHNRHPEPELIRDSMKVLESNGCLFNLKAVERHLDDVKKLVQSKDGTDEFANAQARLRVDQSCFLTVLNQNPASTDGDVFLYTPAYSASSTGRIHQKGGGLQSCTREMKAAAYAGIRYLHNYDLQASQVNALIQFFNDANLDSSWLTTYRDTERNKQVYSERAGLTEETWKKCLLAIVMGAHLPRTTKDLEERCNSILKELAQEAKDVRDDPEKVGELLAGFTDVVMPLVEQIKKWHEWLLTVYLPNSKQPSPAGPFVVNSIGKRLYLSELPDWNCPHGRSRWIAKAKLAAFLLQGVEAAMIHNLTLLGDEYGYTPIANEHDGLIVLNEIPVEAVVKASSMSGFRNANLIEKPFLKYAA